MLRLLDFYTDTCPPCKVQKEVLKELKSDIQVEYVNCSENMTLAQKYQVMSVPTLVIVDGDDEKERFIGLTQASRIDEAIDKWKS